MAQLSYREAIARGLAQEMERDINVVLLGEDVAQAGGVFKASDGLLERFGAKRVLDTPISEQAILGAAMGAAMTGMRPVAEIMFADFMAVCFDFIANEFSKTRYMTDGQVSLPLVVRTANGAGVRFGPQHSQSIENWCMQFAGIKVVSPSTPADAMGLLAAAIRDPDPVIFLEHKALYGLTGEVPEGEHVEALGIGKVVREGTDCTIVAVGMMVHRALAAAEKLAAEAGISAEVIDLRCVLPIDVQIIANSLRKTHRLFTLEENPRVLGWGAEIVSIVADELFYELDGPPVRITAPNVPVPTVDVLEDAWLPSADRAAGIIRKSLEA